MTDASALQKYAQGTVVSLNRRGRTVTLRTNYLRHLPRELTAELSLARKPTLRDNQVVFSDERDDLSVVLRFEMQVICQIEDGCIVAFTLLTTWQAAEQRREPKKATPRDLEEAILKVLGRPNPPDHWELVAVVQSSLGERGLSCPRNDIVMRVVWLRNNQPSA